MTEPTTAAPPPEPMGEEQITQLRAVAAHLLTAPSDSPVRGFGVCLTAALGHIDHLTSQLARLFRYTGGEDIDEAMFQVREYCINLDTTVKLYHRQEAKLAEAMRVAKAATEKADRLESWHKTATLDEIDAELARLIRLRDDAILASVLNGTKIGDVVRIVDPESPWNGTIAQTLHIERDYTRRPLDPDRSVNLTIASQVGNLHTDAARSPMRPGTILVLHIAPPTVCVPHTLDGPVVEQDTRENIDERLDAWKTLHPAEQGGLRARR